MLINSAIILAFLSSGILAMPGARSSSSDLAARQLGLLGGGSTKDGKPHISELIQLVSSLLRDPFERPYYGGSTDFGLSTPLGGSTGSAGSTDSGGSDDDYKPPKVCCYGACVKNVYSGGSSPAHANPCDGHGGYECRDPFFLLLRCCAAPYDC